MIFIEYLSICYIECLIFQQNLDAMPLHVKWLKGQRVPFFLGTTTFYCYSISRALCQRLSWRRHTAAGSHNTLGIFIVLGQT